MVDDKDKSKDDGPRPVMTSSFWFHEEVNPDLELRSRLTKILHDTRSEFQSIQGEFNHVPPRYEWRPRPNSEEIVRFAFEYWLRHQSSQVMETVPFGKTLVLDGKTQSAKLDEFIYHEALVHPALLAHPNPKRVYIGGGGELATAREVLRHKSVEKCVMVDLDKVVVDTSIEMLPEWGNNVAKDPRLELHYTDAHAFLKDNDDTYDVIIMDIADPIEAGPGYVLYTQEFYSFATTRLTPGGILVTQSGAACPHLKDECFTVIHKTLKTVFPKVSGMVADIPSFGSNWGFNLAAKGDSVDLTAFARRDPATTDDQIAARIEGELRFYDGVAHLGLLGTPKWLRTAIEEESRIMTIDSPVFMY